MTRILLALLFVASLSAQSLTRVCDTLAPPVTASGGRALDGTVTVVAALPSAIGDTAYTPINQSFPVTAGKVCVNFAPNDATSPSGTSYKMQFTLGSTTWSEVWVVPTSAVIMKIAAVRVPVTPQPAFTTVQPQQIAGVGANEGDALVWSGSAYLPEHLAGISGPIGPAGPTGPQGSAGAKGDKGDSGPQGLRGAMGYTGATGSVGPQGLTGDTGAIGPQGIRGPTGLPGPACGSDGQYLMNMAGVCTGITPNAAFAPVLLDIDALLPLARLPTIPTTHISGLATVATSGSYTDLTSKPSIPAAQVNSDWNASSGVAQLLNKPSLAAVATSGAYADLTGKPALATVATSGAYTDLTGKPTIPAAQVNSDWTASSGIAQILNKPTLAPVATSGAYTDLTGAPALAPVATSGSYTDLTSKPSIPAAQVNSDWSAGSGVAQILNKPGTYAPSAHAASHLSSGGDPIAAASTTVRGTVTTTTATSQVASTDDSRLSDSRTPTAHASTHLSTGGDPIAAASTTVRGTVTTTTSTSQAVSTDDSRMTNARTPTTHAASHASGGSDPVTPSAIGAEASANKGAVNGYAGLDSNQKLSGSNMPASSATLTWNKYTIAYNDASISGNGTGTGTTSVVVLASNAMIHGIVVKPSVQFTGTSLTALTLSLGLPAGTATWGSVPAATAYASALDLTQAPGVLVFQPDLGVGSFNMGSQTITATWLESGGVLSGLTAGSVDIWIATTSLP